MLLGCAIGLAGAAACALAGPAEPLLLIGVAGAAGAGAAGAGLLKIPDKNAMIVFQSWWVVACAVAIDYLGESPYLAAEHPLAQPVILHRLARKYEHAQMLQ